MNKLEIARKEINEIDKQMLELFLKRMKASEMVAEFKGERGLPIYDAEREKQVINRNCRLEDKELEQYYRLFLQSTMDISKKYQRRLLNGLRVAYSGVEGAYANIAAKKIFEDSNYISYSCFEKAYRSVETGECDLCVLPIENSYAGEVGQVIDLIYDGTLFINGIYSLKISHNLLGIKGAKLEDIRMVTSHSQALSQCRPYIEEHGFETLTATNTAVGALKVKEKNDKSFAAIASEETAKLYDLCILDKGINESDMNATKFAVLSRTENIPKADCNFIILFTVKQVAGALLKAINVISKYGFNMKALRSRPMKEPAWQYYFYVEAEGELSSENGKAMLEELGKQCERLKIAGHYSNVINLENSIDDEE
ncbi:MAG: chorismate mutase [Lachnospiraceae bacterium]|nr:chorismate mutase [Lachnospiraceae bacterium]